MTYKLALFFPFAPQCSHYEAKQRCTNRATVWIAAPDGKLVPGCYVCREHGEACVTEYREKLGETWSLEDLIIG